MENINEALGLLLVGLTTVFVILCLVCSGGDHGQEKRDCQGEG
jgi:hypothetical protein